jgi:hypothetical protein
MSATQNERRAPEQLAFRGGTICMSKCVAAMVSRGELETQELAYILQRHFLGDDGEVCPEDRAANIAARATGRRVVSIYFVTNKLTKVWIITEGDRSSTMVLLPEEY